MSVGKFIVFEGVDNSGKTTVASEISEWLTAKNAKVHLTKHPGSTAIGQEIRYLLKHSEHAISPNTQALLFAADNSQFMNQILHPKLEEGDWVIGDRSNFISSLAYQIASGCSFDDMDKIHAATKQTDKIDLLFVFKCSWKESQRRRAFKADERPDRYEDGGREYFEKLVKCYERIRDEQFVRLAKFVHSREGRINCHYIDANKDLNSVISTVKMIILEHYPNIREDSILL